MSTTPPLANIDDLADMWRPLQDSEVARAANLLAKASALLRQVAPHVDARIAAWQANPADPSGLDPTLVATVVATVVKRFISNVEGVTSQTMGPFSVSYALRGDKDVRGELQVTAGDLNKLRPYRPRARIGSIRVRPALAGPVPFVPRWSESQVIAATGVEFLLEGEYAQAAAEVGVAAGMDAIAAVGSAMVNSPGPVL